MGLEIGDDSEIKTPATIKKCKCGLSTHKKKASIKCSLNRKNLEANLNVQMNLNMCQEVEK